MTPFPPSLIPTAIPACHQPQLEVRRPGLPHPSTTYHLRHNHVQALTRTVHSPTLPRAGLVRPRAIAA
jgi:hypothetical protein